MEGNNTTEFRSHIPNLFTTAFQMEDTTQRSHLPSDASFWFQHPLTNPEQAVLVTWTMLVALIAVAGNTFILVSSIRYNAIRLDRISIILIRNLAASDLGYGLCITTTPVLIITQRNVYGDLACYIISTLSHFFMGTSCIFLSALMASKISSLIFPLHSNIRRYRRGRHISYAIWILMVVFIAVTLTAALIPGDFSVVYSSASFKCFSEFYQKGPLRIVAPIVAIIFFLLPLLVILVTTVWIICYVAKVRGIHRQAVITLMAISAAFVLSYLPTGVFYLLEEVLDQDAKSGYWFSALFRFSLQAANVNFMVNPLIYLVTIKSFAGYTKMLTGKFSVKFNRKRRRIGRRVVTLFSTS